jgi:hypothetical protein
MDSLSLGESLRLGASVLGLLGGIAVWFLGRDRAIAMSDAVNDVHLVNINRRLDEAAAQCSKLAGFVQGLPTRKELDAVEARQVDEHKLRRDINQDIGHLDMRLTKVEVRLDDHVRRIDHLDRH